MAVPDFLHGEPFVRDNPNRTMQAWIKDHDPVSFYYFLDMFDFLTFFLNNFKAVPVCVNDIRICSEKRTK